MGLFFVFYFILNLEKQMDIANIILRYKREENAGLGRIFRLLRRIPRLETMGDIVLYKTIINTLSLNGYLIEDRSITRHFREINKDDYLQDEKREIIKDIKEGACRSREKFLNNKERS